MTDHVEGSGAARGDQVARMEKIVATCQGVIRQDPKNWAAHHDLGVALMVLGRYAEAAEAFDRSYELNRRDLEGLHLAGVALAEAKEFDRAISRWKGVLKTAPRHAPSRYFLGKVYALKGMWDAAIHELKKAIEADPKAKPPLAHTLLAEVCLARGLLNQAIVHLEKARDLDPDDPQIHLNLGAVYLDARQNEGALAESLEAVRRGSTKTAAELNAGIALMRLGRADEAISAYQRGLQRDNRDPELYLNLGEAHLVRGDLEMAVTTWTKALEVSPRHADAHYGLGVAYYRLGRTSDAVKEWTKTLELQPRHRSARVNLAAVYVQAGEHDKAIAEWETVLGQSRNDPDVLASLAELYVRKGDLDEAVDHARQAVIAAPGHPRGQFVLGLVLARRGDIAGGLASLRKAAAKGEDFLKTQAPAVRACIDELTLKALKREAQRSRYTSDAALVGKISELRATPE